MVGPTGRVVGIDLDETKIALARREAAALTPCNVEFGVSKIGDGVGTAEFDAVYTRFVLTHLGDPAAALTWMLGRLPPGGRVVVEDIDCSGHFCHRLR